MYYRRNVLRSTCEEEWWNIIDLLSREVEEEFKKKKCEKLIGCDACKRVSGQKRMKINVKKKSYKIL